MCYTCGCKLPYNAHGDTRNITEADFSDAGNTKKIDRAGLVKAKRNMLELLKLSHEDLDHPKRDYNGPHRH